MSVFENGPRLSRRQVLGGAAGVGLAAALTGCEVQTTSDPGTGTGAEDVDKIKFPDAKAQLPEGDVTYRAMMSGGVKEDYFKAVWTAFGEKHGNIEMQLDATNWDRINEVIPLGMRNNTAPDMFQMPTSVPVQVAVKEGWVAPLEDVIPDFDEWKSAYPETSFIPGVHVFNNKTYSWTFTSSRSQYGELMFYNSKLMEEAGFDPVKERFTWDTLRESAKKITEAGGGKVYGTLISGDSLGNVASNLAELAGMQGGEMNFATGEYNFTHPLLREAIELLLAIKADGSMFPGSLTLKSADAEARFPQGSAGIHFSGPWAVTNWEKTDPDFAYGLAMPPTGNDKAVHRVGYVEGVAAPLFAYADSKHPGVTGELFRYMGSVEGQTALVAMTKGIFASEIEEANEAAKRSSLVSGPAKEAGRIMEELRRIVPLPQVANPDVAQVILEQKPVTPNLKDVVQGIFTEQVKDIGKALKDLQDRSEKSLTDAIAAAQKKGAKVTRDDWKFTNWDPETDYTTKDYESR